MTDYSELVAENLPRVRETIEEAADLAGRSAADVRLVAVTKGHPLAAAEAAIAAGLRDLGENRVGDLEARAARVEREDVRWHMVGHVQRRKVPRLLPAMHLLHSLDSLRLARRIESVAEDLDLEEVPVLVQVNTSGEESKYGFSPEAFRDTLEDLLALARLRVRGLMTMAPWTDDEMVLRSTFTALRALQEESLDHPGYRGSELSMGMSNDYGIAVEEGSTMIRIGTALFGERPR